MKKLSVYIFVISVTTNGVLSPEIANAQQAIHEVNALDMVDIFGDFRFRFEQDWDSTNSSNIQREDRARARIRARLGMNITPNDLFEFGLRFRTGLKNNQQSPHWTVKDFSNNLTGDHDIVVDKWYFKFKKEYLWAWGGRNELPVWKQNELLWDDDVTVTGGTAGIKNYPLVAGNISANTGYVTLPDGMQTNRGEMIFGQLTYSTKVDKVDWTAAGGVLAIKGDSSTPDFIRLGNSMRDYTIWVSNLQARTEISGLPVSLGFDYMYNSENYSATEIAGTSPGTTEDDTEGYVVQIYFGKNKRPGDYLAGYSYADVDSLAVNASYAQDDWMRWGNADQTDASDFHGHEIRFSYVLPWNINMLARYYSVESNNNPNDGDRFRIDFNKKF